MNDSNDESELIQRLFPMEEVSPELAVRIVNALPDGDSGREALFGAAERRRSRLLGVAEALASVVVLGVLVAVASPITTPGRLVALSVAPLLLSYAMAALSARATAARERQDEALPDVMRSLPSPDARVNDYAELAYLRGDFRLAARHWTARADTDVTSAYSLATLYTVTSSRALHERAVQLFSGLVDEPEIRVRCRLAKTVLHLERREDWSSFERELASLAGEDPPPDVHERRALYVARSIASYRELDVPPPPSVSARVSTVWPAVETRISRGGSGRNEVPALLANLLAPCLALPVGVGGSVHVLVPRGMRLSGPSQKVRRLARKAAWVLRDAPVLRAEQEPDDDGWRLSFGYQAAAFLARNGLGGLRTTAVAAVLAFASAAALALGHLRTAGGALVLALLADAVDGQVVQMSAKKLSRSLFVDYLLDRVIDIAFGCGLYFYLVVGPPQQSGALALAFVAAALVVSYVRAEADRFGLHAAGGLVERWQRNAIIALGLLTGHPIYGFFAGTALTSVTAVQRAVRAVSDASAVEPLEESRFRMTQVFIDGSGSDVRRLFDAPRATEASER